MERMEFAKGIQSKALGKLGSKFPAYQTLVSIAFLHVFTLTFFCGSPDGMQTKLLGEP